MASVLLILAAPFVLMGIVGAAFLCRLGRNLDAAGVR